MEGSIASLWEKQKWQGWSNRSWCFSVCMVHEQIWWLLVFGRGITKSAMAFSSDSFELHVVPSYKASERDTGFEWGKTEQSKVADLSWVSQKNCKVNIIITGENVFYMWCMCYHLTMIFVLWWFWKTQSCSLYPSTINVSKELYFLKFLLTEDWEGKHMINSGKINILNNIPRETY